jgi:hypothetical protein
MAIPETIARLEPEEVVRASGQEQVRETALVVAGSLRGLSMA